MNAGDTDPWTHLFWILSRGAGITALILASVTICFGLMMGSSLFKRGGVDRRVYHEVLSLSVMIAIAVHGLSLIGDSFIHPSVFDVTVPFVSSYKTLSTTLGIVAGWSLIFLGLSYYVRDRIGRQRWKLIHRFTVLAWIAGLVHAFTEGTDAGQVWFITLIVVTSAPAVLLLALRIFDRQRRPAKAAAPAAARGRQRGRPATPPRPAPP